MGDKKVTKSGLIMRKKTTTHATLKQTRNKQKQEQAPLELGQEVLRGGDKKVTRSGLIMSKKNNDTRYTETMRSGFSKRNTDTRYTETKEKQTKTTRAENNNNNTNNIFLS